MRNYICSRYKKKKEYNIQSVQEVVEDRKKKKAISKFLQVTKPVSRPSFRHFSFYIKSISTDKYLEAKIIRIHDRLKFEMLFSTKAT